MAPEKKMSLDEVCLELKKMELAILWEMGNQVSAKEASTLHDRLVFLHQQSSEALRDWLYDSGISDKYCITADFMQRKVLHLEKSLLQFFSPVHTISLTASNTKMNDKHATISDLPSLIRKQKFYIEMIDSLEPAGDLESNEVEVQSKHLDQYHEKFIVNQSEIITLIEDGSYDDQVKISQKVQQKVRKIQAKLKDVSAMKTISPAPPTSSLVNEHFKQTERPRVIVDFLDSQLKKQKSVIEQIELIESKKDLNAVEAETLHGHLAQFHDTFVKNQSKIETYVSGPALDEQLRISGEILQKVMTLQIKLKEIFSAAASSPPENGLPSGGQLNTSDPVKYLNWLYERHDILKKELWSIVRKTHRCSLPEIKQLNEWLNSYRKKIEPFVVESPYDLSKLKKVSDAVKEVMCEYEDHCNKRIGVSGHLHNSLSYSIPVLED